MRNFVQWHDNVKPEFSLDKLKKLTTKDMNREPECWTTYGQSVRGEEDPAFDKFYKNTIPFYQKVIARAMCDLSLGHCSNYEWVWWAQAYGADSQDYHRAHSHYDGTGALSWVHFLEVPEKNCFCFMDSKGEEVYPDQQRKNDLIVFPSWAIHKVVPFEGDDRRFVIAGNIKIKIYQSPEVESTIVSTVLNNKTTVIQEV